MTGAIPTPHAWRPLGIPPLTRPCRVYILGDDTAIRVSDDGDDIDAVHQGGLPKPGRAWSPTDAGGSR